jgi:hypothetical protein
VLDIQENTSSRVAIRIPFRQSIVPPNADNWVDDSDKDDSRNMSYYEQIIKKAKDDWEESEMYQYLSDELKEFTTAPIEMIEDESGREQAAVLIVFNLTRPINNFEAKELKEWVTGQMSDGWGEGFEQRAIDSYRDEYDAGYEDEETGEWINETDYGTYEVYAQFWWSDNLSPWSAKIIKL